MQLLIDALVLTKKRCLWAVVMFLSPHAVLRAEEPPAKPVWEVIAECQMVTLPQKAALPLISDLSDDAKIEAAFATLEQMIGRGEATLAASLLVRGGSNEKMVSESFEEMTYPSQWEPPQLPYPVPKEKPVEFLKAWPVVAITPVAFEKRGVGPSLILAAGVSDDGRWVSGDVEVQHVRFLRNQKFDAGIMPSGERIGMEQPVFATLKNTFSVHVQTGQRLLVGIHKVPKEENTMELFFLRIRTQLRQPAAK